MLNHYKAIPGFLTWYSRNRFTLINDANAKYYYILFLQDKKCSNNDCINCNGEYINYEKESDIAEGRLVSKRCIKLVQERRKKEAEGLQKAFKIPVKYEQINWGNITISPISKANLINYSQRFPNNKPNGLYLYSTNPMSGKTSALWVLVKDLITQLKITSIIIQSTAILLTKTREDEFTEDGINYAMRNAIYCDLLALDDFGMEKQTAWSNDKMYTIINERSNQNRPTILVSSIEPDPLLWQSPFEKSIIGKILESSICINLDTKETA